MWIESVQVDGGFLDGLDLRFSRGLNVIIGARGVGKTSVLELIRYALRLPHVDSKRAAGTMQHAEAVLANGRVTVTYVRQGNRQTISRSASDPKIDELNRSQSDQLPFVLGQNELEKIGLDPRSRMRLLDTHARIDPMRGERDIARISGQAASLTDQIRSIARQCEKLRQMLLVRDSVSIELANARRVESEILERAGSAVGRLREELAFVDREVAQRHADSDAIEGLNERVYVIESTAAKLAADLEELQFDIRRSDALATFIQDFNMLQNLYEEFGSAAKRLRNSIDHKRDANQQEIAELMERSRPVRRQYEEFQEGAGAATHNLTALEQQLREIDRAEELLKSLEKKLLEARKERAVVMMEIDRIRESLWVRRDHAARELNEGFLPKIRVVVDHFGDRTAYASHLANALRGSGLQYNQLADWISERLSPEELTQCVETGDAARLSLLGEITSARVEKLISYLADSKDLGSVVTSPIDDTVSFELLAGRDYRKTDQLSTGQRCAVVLPLLLADEDRGLLLDQPEDHLDNAYLVENTIRHLRNRSESAQTIVVTHNANIPVLGEAEMVVSLDSDGRRGFVTSIGPLESERVVSSITELMEGGREAFARRARFYGSR